MGNIIYNSLIREWDKDNSYILKRRFNYKKTDGKLTFHIFLFYFE